MPPVPAASPKDGPRDGPSARLRRISREDALEQVELASLARAYLERQPVYLGRGDFWRWDRDGIPGWLVPKLEELGFLP